MKPEDLSGEIADFLGQTAGRSVADKGPGSSVIEGALRLEDFAGEVVDLLGETAGPVPDKARSWGCSAGRR